MSCWLTFSNVSGRSWQIATKSYLFTTEYLKMFFVRTYFEGAQAVEVDSFDETPRLTLRKPPPSIDKKARNQLSFFHNFFQKFLSNSDSAP